MTAKRKPTAKRNSAFFNTLVALGGFGGVAALLIAVNTLLKTNTSNVVAPHQPSAADSSVRAVSYRYFCLRDDALYELLFGDKSTLALVGHPDAVPTLLHLEMLRHSAPDYLADRGRDLHQARIVVISNDSGADITLLRLATSDGKVIASIPRLIADRKVYVALDATLSGGGTVDGRMENFSSGALQYEQGGQRRALDLDPLVACSAMTSMSENLNIGYGDR